MNRVITLHDPVEMCVVLCDLTSVQTYIFEFPAKICQNLAIAIFKFSRLFANVCGRTETRHDRSD